MVAIRKCVLIVVLSLCAALQAIAWPALPGLSEGAAPSQKGSQDKAQMRSGGDVPVFRSRVNLVMVPVVVRDSHGNSIGDLRREDFQLLDDGKPQAIKHFAVERPEPREEATSGTGVQKSETGRPFARPTVARRFIAWLIDDSQEPGMFSAVKLAADRMLGELRPGDRVAVYLASKYEPLVDFTDDAAALRKAVLRIAPWPRPPEVDENVGSEKCMTTLAGVILPAISSRPGERSVVVVSPGFLYESAPDLVDRAIQSNVVINTLDTRGVYTNFTFKVSYGTDAHGNEIPEPTIQQKAELAIRQSEILEYLADGTGGVYFHSDNDLYEGLRRTTEAAEYRYILGFSPKDWRSEDDFHRLKVKVDRPGVEIQARRGYSPQGRDGTVILAGQQQNKNTPASKDAGSQNPSVAQAGANRTASAAGSAEKPPTFKAQVSLVMLPVIVRDARGNPVGNLKRENFRVFDNGKEQKISQFSIESAATRGTVKAGDAGASAPPTAGRRFVAYVFDDLHLDTGDLAAARKAAELQLAALKRGERVALYTTSGRNSVEFTDDTAKLREVLLRLTPRAQVRECPDLGGHWAAQIDNLGYATDNLVVSAAIREMAQCPGNQSLKDPVLQALLRNAVSRILMESERDAQFSLALLRSVVTRMSALPGERTIVTVSPGFLPRHQEEQLAQVIERAVQTKVVVNAVDARGVYTNSMFDAGNGASEEVAYMRRQKNGVLLDPASLPSAVAMQIRTEMASLQADVLEQLADGTGGFFFHSNNDMNEGFRKTAGVAEYTYMIGFTPEIAKAPNADPYHRLQVKLENAGRGLTMQARRSYKVDTEPSDPLHEQIEQIRMAMYSRAEMMEIPMKLNTEVARTSVGEATLKVAVQLDLKDLPFRKETDRNSDDLEVHAGIFDHNGKYVTGKGSRIELRLLDETVSELNSGAPLAQGSNLDMDFPLKPGDYVVRVVVREAENQLMSTGTSTVQIP